MAPEQAPQRQEGGDADLPAMLELMLRRLLPHAERDEVLDDLRTEYRARAERWGRGAASRWAWRQGMGSIPALIGRGWWSGWSGFEPRANRWKPGGGMFQNWGRDIRYTLRRLRLRPTYAVLTVLTLALGVAGTAAAFSIAKRLLMEPLPVRAEQEVVVFWMEGSWSRAEFMALRPEIGGFESLAAYRLRDATFQPADGPARLVRGVAATAELFEVLGARPSVGPGFRPGDDRLGTEPVAVLSHAFWRELGGDPRVVGQPIELGGVSRTVVGVMPPGFWFPDPTVRVWVSEQLNPEDYSGNWGLIGRLQPSTPAGALRGELDRVMGWMHEQFDYPEGEWDKRANPELTPLREYLTGSLRPSLLALLAAMAAILLIACVNVAALMLGQVDNRRTELAVRSALGAERGQILRQLTIEAAVIGCVAGLVGAGLAAVAFRFLQGALPLGALAEAISVDWAVFWGAMAIAVTAALLIALVPALSVARSDLQQRLTRARTAGIAGRGGRLEAGLVVAQVALILLIAAGAGLLIRSVGNLRAIEPGVAIEGTAVIDVVMPITSPIETRPPTLARLVETLSSLPGVQSAAATQRLPLRGSSDNWGIAIAGRDEPQRATTAFRVVTPEYFQTMGIGLVSGRLLLESDRDPSAGEGAVVINRALADAFFPGEDPIGQHISFMSERWDRIVGVVENVAESELTPDPVPARYMVYEQVPWLLHQQTLVLRMHRPRDAATILDAARRAIQSTAPEVAIQETTTMANVFDRAIGPARQVMTLLSMLGGMALILGSIGVYGVVSHFVIRRTRDWGIRLALGMRPGRVVRSILSRGGALVATGIVVGLIAFLSLARLLGTFLYGVSAADPLSVGTAIAVLACAGLLAAYVPARRASRIDPALVLREQ